MIHVRLLDPEAVVADALMRSVGTDLEACTGGDQRVGDAAGAEVLDPLRAFGDVPIGGALVTPGGGLRTPLLIHIVVRSSEEPVSEETIARALRNGLRQATEWEVGVLAVLPLGTGAGNLDAEVSARVMCAVLRQHLEAFPFPREILLPVSSPYEEEAFATEAARVLAGPLGRGRDARDTNERSPASEERA